MDAGAARRMVTAPPRRIPAVVSCWLTSPCLLLVFSWRVQRSVRPVHFGSDPTRTTPVTVRARRRCSLSACAIRDRRLTRSADARPLSGCTAPRPPSSLAPASSSERRRRRLGVRGLLGRLDGRRPRRPRRRVVADSSATSSPASSVAPSRSDMSTARARRVGDRRRARRPRSAPCCAARRRRSRPSWPASWIRRTNSSGGIWYCCAWKMIRSVSSSWLTETSSPSASASSTSRARTDLRSASSRRLGVELLAGLALLVEELRRTASSSWSKACTASCTRDSTSASTTLSGSGTSVASTSASSTLSRACGDLLHVLDPAEPLAQVGAQLVQGVELAGQLGELVVRVGQLALLDRGDGRP